jgi:hypothetical protein
MNLKEHNSPVRGNGPRKRTRKCVPVTRKKTSIEGMKACWDEAPCQLRIWEARADITFGCGLGSYSYNART